ncbi:hypothetical protein Q9Q94_13425 [Uliginosibacterium sp. 31-16]|uniref:hypothetical protein n=1 Tax=Uliginosibacterium sp. 31-16 TaxID=3068315 RepID=UPI00273E4518|nr:hypothetical protein [Uliginosibacterium sp. 31-16]MDP5240539.1 hypothetical protein [Uliginosibacterium sp. 31-16]
MSDNIAEFAFFVIGTSQYVIGYMLKVVGAARLCGVLIICLFAGFCGFGCQANFAGDFCFRTNGWRLLAAQSVVCLSGRRSACSIVCMVRQPWHASAMPF